MSGFVSWLLLIAGSFIAPLYGPPTVIFVPGWVLNWVSLPESDFSCHLVTTGRFADVLGTEGDVEGLKYLRYRDAANPDGRPDIVRVLVDLNQLSPIDVLRTTVPRIRSGWDLKRKVIFFFEFCRVEHGHVPPMRDMNTPK